MNKKTLIITLFFSMILTIGIPVFAFALNLSNISDGVPLKWTSFSFFGSETNYNALFIDILFWFAVIFGIWKFIQKTSNK